MHILTSVSKHIHANTFLGSQVEQIDVFHCLFLRIVIVKTTDRMLFIEVRHTAHSNAL